MSQNWSKSEQSRYEKLRQSAEQSGKPAGLAKKIATKMIENQRGKKEREQPRGRKKLPEIQESLESETKNALYERAKRLNIKHRGRMNKATLIDAILSHSASN